MRRALRLIHCADVHLDSDYYGGDWNFARATAGRQAFTELLRQTTEAGADLLLIAGDLFDHNRASDATVAFVGESLAALPMPVVLIPGNHDCLVPDGVLRRLRASPPASLNLMDTPQGASLHLPRLGLTLWGRGLVEHTPQYRPMANAPDHPGGWHVGLAHGLTLADDTASLGSSLIRSAEIAASHFDYLALGHVHGVREVSAGDTTAWYPGNTVPCGREAGTFLRVDLVPGLLPRVTLESIPARR